MSKEEYEEFLGKIIESYKKEEQARAASKVDPHGWKKLQDTIDEASDKTEDDDWGYYDEIIDVTPVDPNVVSTYEQAELLEDGALLVDADGYAFQRRSGEWFMAGGAFGATEFSGTLPARIANLTS